MKKFITALAAASMVIGMSAAGVFAAETGSLGASAPETVEINSEFDVKLELTTNPGLLDLGVVVNYDHEQLELLSYTDSSRDVFTIPATPKVNATAPKLSYSMGSSHDNTTATGSLGTLHFKAKEGFTGAATINLTDRGQGFTYDVDFNRVEVSAASVTVQVACTSHSWDAGVETTPPTCGQDGLKTYTCTLCGESRTETIPATGNHTWTVDDTTDADGWKVTKEADCTEAGEKIRVCSVCGTSPTESIDPLGHDWDEGTVTKPATCTEPGVLTKTCKREGCGITADEPIKALGHNVKEEDWKVTTEADCTKAGVETAHCDRCDQDVTREIKALGHQWDAGKITKGATATEAGEKTYTCERCKETKIEKIAATGSGSGGSGTSGSGSKGTGSTGSGSTGSGSKASGTAKSSASGSVNTGDPTEIALYAGLAIAALAAAGSLVVISAKRKKRADHKEK